MALLDRRQYALQIKIGVFVLVSLGVFLAVIYLLGAQARYFERKYNLIAEFTEVGGLIEGATVRLAGVQIGRVTDVRLSPEMGGKVRVTLTMARRFSDRIRQDSEARIITQGLLGDKLVEITIGTPAAAPLKPGDALRAQEPFEVGRVFSTGAETLATINQLALTLQASVDRLNRDGTLDDLGATVKSARRLAAQLEGFTRGGAYQDFAAAARSTRRITEEVEKGKGLLHALIYDEPETLRRLNALLGSAQELMARAEQGDHAISVLLSPRSGEAARSLVTAMEKLGRSVEQAGDGDGLLPALLFDPQYKPVAEDLQTVARNFREVSERLARGEGVLGSLLQDRGDGGLGQAAVDFRAAMANLRTITDRVRAGEGTVGALLEDPTVYENLASFLEGAQRSFLLRSLFRSTIGGPGDRRKGGEK
jgi:phospholipid/cholesterol/gamma-HCH transport system substrate-binding protein